MCTLSVITRANGYLLGMNRDEKIARGAGVPPQAREIDGTKAIYPSDGSGGTWAVVNEHGVALALLNWNDVIPRVVDISTRRSRGLVIPSLIRSRSLMELQLTFGALELEGTLPFRLVGLFPFERQICEWRWDSGQIEFLPRGWEVRHWFSSSLSDKQVKSVRGAACQAAWNEPDAGSARWLRRLHASHGDIPGPFSLCVHRPDVKTLSYTEIECTRAIVRMEHFIGSPCLIDGSGKGTTFSRAV